RVISTFTRLGTRRVRITGGEPLVRKDIPQLARRLSSLPQLDDLSLSTNATRMARHADELKSAGISRINVSLDSLNSTTFKQLTGGKLEKVLDGLMAAKNTGFKPIKVNMVLMKDINDHEVEDMVDFCIEHGFTLRFIEIMPVGDMGRKAIDNYINLQDIKNRLASRFDLIPGVMPGGGPARYLQVANTDINIGFITPMSQHFCETCNRVRLSVDGTIYTCLGQEHHFELRPLLRAGISNDELEQAIRTAINLKPEKHEFNDHPEKVLRFMSYTGG
ncbi:MAG: GTP 3',8-cyclase MoaA, partial [Gammaproteobacteria bacterium]|nr:GTP 3',8-cyclase MoaA [Gammaproteobacteria bacterium]